jgi:WD40 repeat protein
MLALSSKSGTEGRCTIADAGSGMVHRILKNDPCARPHAIAYSSSSNVLASSQERNCIFFFNPAVQRPLQKCFMPEQVTTLAFTHCGRYLIGGAASGSLFFWLVESGELMSIAKGHLRAVTAVSPNCKGTLVCSASEDATVRVWSTSTVLGASAAGSTPSAEVTFSNHTLAVTCCSFFLSKDWVVCGSKDRTVSCFDAWTGSTLLSVQMPHRVASVLLMHAESLLAVGGEGGSLSIVSLYPDQQDLNEESRQLMQQSGRVLPVVEASHSHQGEVFFLASRHDGNLLSVSDDGVVLLWSTPTPNRMLPRLLHDLSPTKTKIHLLNCCLISVPPTVAFQADGENSTLSLIEKLKEAPSHAPPLAKFPTLAADADSRSIPPLTLRRNPAVAANRKRSRSGTVLPSLHGRRNMLQRLESKRDALLELANALLQQQQASDSDLASTVQQ